MNTNRNYTWVGVVVLAVILVIGGTYYLSQKENSANNPVDNSTPTTNETPASDAIRITAKHSFDNGTHTVIGELAVPTPCHTLDVTAMIAESYPEQVTLAFTSVTPDDMCAQVMSNRRFKISFQASEEATMGATWNGTPVFLNLIPVSAEETETFDIYIKG